MDIGELDRKSKVLFETLSKRGLLVDKSVFEAVVAKYQPTVERIESDLGLNLSSPKEVAIFLQQQGIKLPMSDKGNPRTGADVLEYLPQTPEITKILEGRSVKTTVSLAKSLVSKVNTEGKLYSEYRFKEELGRVHAAKVNYLNWGPELKAAIRARPGFKIISADWKQHESRVLQFLSGDLDLKAALESDDDFHEVMASDAFGVLLAKVTQALREASKEITFGLVYGKTAYGLARTLGIPEDEAKEKLEKYFAKFPAVTAFLDATKEDAMRTGKVETYFGRVRDLTSLIKRDRKKAERLAVSHKVQGTAGDLMRIAILKLEEVSESMGATLLGQIHDNFFVEVPVIWGDSQAKEMFDQALIHSVRPFELAYDVKEGV